MKMLNAIKVGAAVVTAAAAINMTGFTYAVSSTAPHKVKDFQVVAHSGGKVRPSEVAVAVLRGYPGARPNIIATPKPMYPNCYNVRFKYHGNLIRLTFNCSKSETKLSMSTR
ncbi:MAG: hypothetical protein CSB47_08300 [Proteobacteria bacterium]|nr:MAG: hypothetical protein CSB47_08300 [Pseudomonadota bacterium]